MKKVSEETKAKLIYSGELIVISLVVLTIGILRLCGIIQYSNTRRFIFNIVTSLGGIYVIYNIITYIASKKKREKTSLVDLLTTSPIGLVLLVFNIYCFITMMNVDPENITEDFKNLFRYFVGSVLCYAGATFMFQGIYHYFKPIPMLINIINEENKENNNDEIKQ